MTGKTFSDPNALEGKLERIAALQQAIEQASQEVQTAAQLMHPEEQQVMLRILAQRRRLQQRAAQPGLERSRRSAARAGARASSATSANASATASAWAEAAGATVPRSIAADASALMQSVPWVADAKNLAMRRPVAVGLALGATLVIVGPRRLFRSVLWWTPFVWRSMRVAQRVNTTIRKRY